MYLGCCVYIWCGRREAICVCVHTVYLHCRVCLPPQPFLVVLFSTLHSKPEFYESVTVSGRRHLDFALSTCHDVIQLSRVCMLIGAYHDGVCNACCWCFNICSWMFWDTHLSQLHRMNCHSWLVTSRGDTEMCCSKSVPKCLLIITLPGVCSVKVVIILSCDRTVVETRAVNVFDFSQCFIT